MVDRNLLREFNVSDEDLEAALGLSLADADATEEDILLHAYNQHDKGYDVNAVLEGTIVRVEGFSKTKAIVFPSRS